MLPLQGHPTPVLSPGKSQGRGAWWAAVHGVAKSRSRLNDFTVTFHFHAMGKEMAIHSSVLAWRNPGMAEPGGLPFMGSHRVGHNWSNLAAAAAVPIMKRTSQCKSKPQWGVNSHHSEWPLLNKQTKKNLQIINAGQSAVKREPSYTTGANVNWHSHYGE